MPREGHIFICHSSRDADIARKLTHRIEDLGRTCWVAPRDVESAKPYPRQLVEAIESCGVFILLITHHSANSEHVLREVEQATKRKKTLLPIVINGAMSADLDYFVGAIHQITGSVDEAVDQVASYFASSSAKSPPTQNADIPGSLTVGLIPFPPFSAHPTATSGPTGFYVELLNRLSQETGILISYRPITNEQTIPLLADGTLDLVACLYRSPRRMANYLFAACFYASTITAVVRADNSSISSQRDLLDPAVRVAVCKGEIGSELAQDAFHAAPSSGRLTEVDSVDVKSAAAMVAMGMADVAITDTVTCQLMIRSSPVPLKEVFSRRPLFVGHIGLVLPKTSVALAAMLNSSLADLRLDSDFQRFESEILAEYPDLVELL